MSSFITEANLNFAITSRIGGGGEGDVFKAQDHQLDAILAVKKVLIEKLKNKDNYFEECKKLYLTRHHNIVDINYGCKDDEYIYIAMPFYKNGSLKKLLDERFLTSKEIVRYSLQFLSGLNNVHIKDLIHFDIKPSNILLSDSDTAQISDFGLAKEAEDYGFAKVDGTTIPFAPPEFFAQRKHNFKFDIYQSGLTLYRMCVGDRVFSQQHEEALTKHGNKKKEHLYERVMKGSFPNRSYYFPHIPRSLRKVIKNALEVDPNNRYDSVLDMMDEIAKIPTTSDWQFETDYSSFERWTKPNYQLDCSISNGSWKIVAEKKGSSSFRKKKKYCGTKLNKSEKDSLCYKALNEEW